MFCIVLQKENSAEKFDRLVKQHGFTPEDMSSAKYLPKPKIGEIEFRPGILIPTVDGEKSVTEADVQAVFTTTDKSLVRAVKSSYNGDNYVCTSNPLLDKIMSKYVPEIKQKFPELDFEDKRYADGGTLSVEFKFGIQPYNFDFHSPRDMDVLKPITIIDGYVIHPSSQTVSGLRWAEPSPVL